MFVSAKASRIFIDELDRTLTKAEDASRKLKEEAERKAEQSRQLRSHRVVVFNKTRLEELKKQLKAEGLLKDKE